MKKKLRGLPATLLALALSLLVVFPLVYGVLGAFKTAAEFSAADPALLPRDFSNWDNFLRVFERLPIGRMFLNSLIVALLAAVVRTALAVLAAYAFAFYEFKGKKFLFFLLLGTMMLPADTLIVTNYQTVSNLGLLDTYLGMAIVSFVGASQMFMLRQQFQSLPKALREAALLDGCGDFRFLWHILLPLSRPVLATLFVQSFINVWNAYLWPLMVTNNPDMRTIQVGIAMLTSRETPNAPLILAGVTLSLIPAILLFLLLRRTITHSAMDGALVE